MMLTLPLCFMNKGGIFIILTLFSLFDYGILLLFGVFVSAMFCDIAMNKKNIIYLLLFSAILIIIESIFYAIFGIKLTEEFYPLITHLPLLLFLVLYYKKQILASIYSIASAYLCCQISDWMSLLSLEIIGEMLFYHITHVIVTFIIFFIIFKYFAATVALIITKSGKTIHVFGILPVSYYLFDYIATVYSNLLYNGSIAVLEFLPFMFCLAFLLFSTVYFREYEQKIELDQQQKIMQIQTKQTMKQIEEIQRREYEVSLIRHDMRHFLNNILSYIEDENIEDAKTYIHQIIQVTDKTIIQKYCKNQLVNMVLSSYHNQLTDLNIQFDISVQIPETLPCSEVDFTSILANGLENAMKAVGPLEDDKRIIILRIKMNGNKLLLSIKNPYDKEPDMQDGIPVSHESGHGFGVQSIRYVTQRLGGNCQFITKDNMFILQVIL